MKTLLKYTGVALLGIMALTACSPDSFDSPNSGAKPVAANYADNVVVTVDQDANTAYFTFKSAPGVTPVWVFGGSQYSSDFTTKKYQRKAGDYVVELRVKNANGISDDAVPFAYHIDKTRMSGFGGFDVDSPDNLFNSATMKAAKTFYATGEDWHDPGAQLGVLVNDKDISVSVPIGTVARWQCQVPFETTVSTTASDDVTYDFSCILTSNKAFKAMIKFTNPNDDNDFYFAEEQQLNEGEPVCFYMTELPSRAIENLKLFFDFGGCPDATEVTVENLVFIEHSKNKIVAPEKDEPEPVWREAENIWDTANPTLGKTYYATGGDWHDPGAPLNVTVNGEDIVVNVPVGTEARWQVQVPINLSAGLTAGVEYDFLAVVESNNAFKAMFKLADPADEDNNFLFAEEKDLVAGGEIRFVQRQVKIGNSCDNLKMVFDFGTCPNNTEIHISKIILQEHKE